MDTSPAILMPSSLQTPQTQEQNGILDWLRKLRLHKYYPVFKQLSMEKVCRFSGWPYRIARLFSQDLPGGIEFPNQHKVEEVGRPRRLFLRETVGFAEAACSCSQTQTGHVVNKQLV